MVLKTDQGASSPEPPLSGWAASGSWPMGQSQDWALSQHGIQLSNGKRAWRGNLFWGHRLMKMRRAVT